jgi:uncharacterized cupredoxin-like copper-binding protein
MKKLMRGVAMAVALLTLSAVLVAGCGGSDENESAATTTEAVTEGNGSGGGGGGQSVEIKMGDFFFNPKDATASAGSTTITAPNDGSVEHELVLFKTNTNPADLPTKANGEVDEEKLDQQAQEGGELADVEAGKVKSGKFNLTPGKYVMFCNLPGHYAAGMYGTLTVK